LFLGKKVRKYLRRQGEVTIEEYLVTGTFGGCDLHVRRGRVELERREESEWILCRQSAENHTSPHKQQKQKRKEKTASASADSALSYFPSSSSSLIYTGLIFYGG
jgi:hypothetical protein